MLNFQSPGHTELWHVNAVIIRVLNSFWYCWVIQCKLSHTLGHTLCLTKTDLGNEDQTKCDSAAEDDHQCYNAELDIGLVSGQERHSGANDAHDAHVVHTHPDVFAVIEGRDAHVPCLPCQETAKQLSGKEREKVKHFNEIFDKRLNRYLRKWK